MGIQPAQDRERTSLPWVDFMRFLGAFLVVLAHIENWGAGRPVWAQTIYFTISRIGVPLFFLISGYLLLGKQEDIRTFFKKRAVRIAIPFLVWSIIYDVKNSQAFAETGITVDGILSMFVRILRGPREGHLWFFYSLIGLYLITPILRVFIARARNTDILYYLSLWFLVVPILFIVEAFTPIKNGFEIYYTGGYIGYFLLGYLLGGLEIKAPLLWLALGLFIISFLFTFAVFYLNLPPQDNELVFRSYPSLNIIFMSLGAFVLVKAVGEKVSPRMTRLSSEAGKVSFGIYLIHPLVYVWMSMGWNALGFQTDSGNSILVIPLAALVNFLLSWIIVFMIGKIPFLRAVV
jgi:surface polysaccharide O-acyltransferase-like enzyme